MESWGRLYWGRSKRCGGQSLHLYGTWYWRFLVALEWCVEWGGWPWTASKWRISVLTGRVISFWGPCMIGNNGWRIMATLRWCVLLHETVNFEPVWSSAVTRARFRHTHHQTLPKPTCFARCSVFLVNDTSIIVLTFLDHRLVVASSSKEWFTSLASKSSKVKPGCWLPAHSALLILHRVHSVQLKRKWVKFLWGRALKIP